MHADVGDRIIVCSESVDGADRTGEVIDVRHPDGRPPYLIRWDDTRVETLVYPGSNAFFMYRSRQSPD